MDMFSYNDFDHLYNLWKNEQRTNIRLNAIILSTEMPGLDEKITGFISDYIRVFDDMSGPNVAVYVSSNNTKDNYPYPGESNERFRDVYREISYSLGRLLQVTPEQFPCIVFFDNLIRAKDIVVIELIPILGQEPEPGEISRFFVSLFTLTQLIAALPDEKRLKALRKAVILKWGKKKDLDKYVQKAQALLPFADIAIKTADVISKYVFGGRPDS